VTLLALPPADTAQQSTQDPALLRWGLDLADQHQADPTDPTRCSNQRCRPHVAYPCQPRRIADRLITASTAGWPHCWTARIDALSCGLSPSGDAAGITEHPSTERERP
jgi:hypothetical protein